MEKQPQFYNELPKYPSDKLIWPRNLSYGNRDSLTKLLVSMHFSTPLFSVAFFARAKINFYRKKLDAT